MNLPPGYARRIRGLALIVGLALSASACRGAARIPQDLTQVRTRTEPAHRVTVAVLPFEDARTQREAPDKAGRYVYSGTAYVGTNLQRLDGAPMDRVTEVVARHLSRARVFERMMLVLDPSQAEEADLLLTAKVLRARGYVEAEAPDKDSGRPADERKVLAEVVLEDVTLTPNAPGATARFQSDAGWSLLTTRRLGPDGAPPDPWVILAETLDVALDRLVAELSAADLSGGYEVLPEVALEAGTASVATATAARFGRLLAAPPRGWSATETSSAAAPAGWRGAADCAALALEARQTLRFSRSLGPYRPAVRVWACPAATRRAYDGRADFPATLLGRRAGRLYFGLQVGRTNWPDALAQVRRHLALTPPPGRHVFEVGGETLAQ